MRENRGLEMWWLLVSPCPALPSGTQSSPLGPWAHQRDPWVALIPAHLGPRSRDPRSTLPSSGLCAAARQTSSPTSLQPLNPPNCAWGSGFSARPPILRLLPSCPPILARQRPASCPFLTLFPCLEGAAVTGVVAPQYSLSWFSSHLSFAISCHPFWSLSLGVPSALLRLSLRPHSVLPVGTPTGASPLNPARPPPGLSARGQLPDSPLGARASPSSSSAPQNLLLPQASPLQ